MSRRKDWYRDIVSNLIYEGDHYSYVIHTDLEHDFVVDDEYLWNMDDQVGLIMPVDKMNYSKKVGGTQNAQKNIFQKTLGIPYAIFLLLL